MNNLRFTSFLTSNISGNDNMTQELLSRCNSQKAEKGSFLLREGDKIAHSFFVEQGLLRQYTIDNKGKEHILQFAPENWFISNRESEFLNLPSSYFIDAIEETTVLIIPKVLIQTFSSANPDFSVFNNQLLHRHIASLQKRITQLQSVSARDRYLDFIKIYPDLMLRVPQTYVASYLGITPESLSRIRKELADEHFAAS